MALSWLYHGCDLVVHHCNGVARILRRWGGAIGRDGEKSGHRFSEKIMLKQQAKAKYRINLK
jgi:hypothetical protein